MLNEEHSVREQMPEQESSTEPFVHGKNITMCLRFFDKIITYKTY